MSDDKAQPLWTPSQQRIAASNMTRYLAFLKEKCGLVFSNYADLYDWSVSHIGEFWTSVWDFTGIIHSKPFSSALEGDDIRNAFWFDGARLNFAENLLRFRDDHTALIYWSEDDSPRRLTYAQLHHEVAACAAGLKKLEVTAGDRVAAFIANQPEAIIGMLAATSIGAAWSSCSPDFGFQGVLDRFGQIKPKVLIAGNGYRYNGRNFDCSQTIKHLTESIPEIEKVAIVSNVTDFETACSNKSMRWDELLDYSAKEIVFEQLPFDHPVYIMFSSGTTGAPKCIVHGAGGTLLQHFKELRLHTDLKREDVISYYTTCGWMMWNWLVCSLGVGATVFLYNGSPSYPDIGQMFKAIENEHITIFGTSPRFLTSCEQANLEPARSFNLSSLRTILSTGSPLSVQNFDYVYHSVKSDVQLSSISGGTDIISCFMLGNPLLPVYAGELQCRGLGMKVLTYNEIGMEVIDQVGELVCAAPFPSRPIYFWNDPHGRKYEEAYFNHFPGVWRHGDYIRINSRGGVIVYGRSDATLNPGGVRIGTAEIYAPVESLDEIADSLVIGQKFGGDTRIVLFVVLRNGYHLDENLKRKIQSAIRHAETPRHVPQVIIQVGDIPRTLNGKKVEMAVTKIIHGETVGNKDALANPDSLNQFIGLQELEI